MKQIGSLFDKYKKTLRPPQASVEKEALQVIKKITKIDFPIDNLSYNTSTRTLKINAPSIVRSEIVRHKKDILNTLRQTLGVSHSPTELL